MVLLAMWALVVLLIAGYIWFMVWRLRMERRKKELRADEPTKTGLAARLAEQGALPPLEPATLVAPPAAQATSARASIADLLAGIRLPEDLVPITMMEPRGDITERVAFASDPGADAKRVGTAFADELQRLGYTVTASGADQLAATRADDNLLCQLHVDAQYAEIGGKRAFPAVPDNAVVIEVWIPF